MDINFDCVHCGHHISIDESGADSTIECPGCYKLISVPEKPKAEPSPLPIAVAGCSIPAHRKIKFFIAGALALTGFENVITLPRYFAFPAAFIGVCFVALQLPLGLGLLFERPIAFRLTKIYLWLVVVLGGFVVFVSIFSPKRQTQVHVANALLLQSTTSLLVPSILLGLLLWSGWRERRNERQA
jgi:hypothetical protein